MQGADRARRPERGVKAVGLLQGTRVDGLDGVQSWARFVIRLDAFEIKIDEFVTCRLSRLQRGSDVTNGCVQKMESCSSRRSCLRMVDGDIRYTSYERRDHRFCN